MALYDWKDGLGRVHSIPLAQHQANQRAKNPAPAKGQPGQPGVLPPPPVGTYDPAIDYNAGASQRGYGNTQDDAATAYETGTEDHNVNLAGLLRQHNDVLHNYQVLGNQQAGAARQHGITSAGLLQLSADKRAANQAHDLVPIDAATTAENANYARTFGGYGGHEILDPYTGKPVFGSLLTSLTRAGTENNAFQTASAGQRAFGAAANNYVPPAPPVMHPVLSAFLKKRRPPAPPKGILR